MNKQSSGLQITDLSFDYPDRGLFRNWSVHLLPGLNWITGDEAVGKSTLLRLLAGLLPLDRGELTINGTSLGARPQDYTAQVFLTGYQTEAFEQVTPFEYFNSLRPKYPALNQTLLVGLYGAFDLTPHLDKKLFMLSNGSKRKVWLAAAFASGAALTLIDDPFSALDRASVKVVRELLEDATDQAARTFVVADYEVPEGLAVTQVIELSPPPA
jgi:ABC-type multidrug transport system ATPase subunit